MNYPQIISKNLLLISFTLALLLAACKKPDIQGPKGDPGTSGPGNSNFSSGEFTINSSQWIPNSDSTLWQVSVTNPLLTGVIVENGGIKLFIQTAQSWTELPHEIEEQFMQFSFEEGLIRINNTELGGDKLDSPPATSNFRLITFSETN